MMTAPRIGTSSDDDLLSEFSDLSVSDSFLIFQYLYKEEKKQHTAAIKTTVIVNCGNVLFVKKEMAFAGKRIWAGMNLKMARRQSTIITSIVIISLFCSFNNRYLPNKNSSIQD